MRNPDRVMHPARLDEKTLIAQCDIQRTKRSGPGGQHRNKVETAVVLKHQPTGVEAAAGERRSQSENLKTALFRLRVNLALEVRSDQHMNAHDEEIRPSELWRSRCRNQRIAVNPEHEDFPVLLAEALDVITREGPDLQKTVEFLNCSRTQLVKFLKLDRRGFALLNRWRKEAGLPVLK